MARTGPRLSKNPGKTARFYRKNKASREKHRRTQRAINARPEKKAYRRDLMKIRRARKPGPQTDMSHKAERWLQNHVRKTEEEAELRKLNDTITTKP